MAWSQRLQAELDTTWALLEESGRKWFGEHVRKYAQDIAGEIERRRIAGESFDILDAARAVVLRRELESVSNGGLHDGGGA